MTLLEHLEELRSRLLWSLGAWVLGSAAGWFLVPPLLEWSRPLLGEQGKLIFISPHEAFFAYLKLAMVLGLLLALPFILYQFLAFVFPGLTERERKWTRRLLFPALLLFVLGAIFASFVVLPVTMRFFLGFALPGSLEAQITIGNYVGWLVGIVGLVGLSFELPLVLLVAALVGLIDSKLLRRQRRLAIFLAFLLAAVVTPTPDAFTCSVVAVPLVLLFELSLVLMRLVGK